MHLKSICGLLLLFFSPLVAGETESYRVLQTRPGVDVPTWVIVPDKTIHASVILFSGGGGKLKIDEDGIGRTGNFLVRSRYRFTRQGFVTLVPDKPSDQGSLSYFRTTQAHAQDVAAMIAWLRQTHAGKPVWLIGISRGTISVANAAASLPANTGPDGIVLAASLTRQSHSGKDSLQDLDLEKIHQRVLLIHHEQDACYVTPPEDIPKLLQAFTASTDRAMKMFSGGQDNGSPCKGQGFHGFNGIEDEVINHISNWIKQQR